MLHINADQRKHQSSSSLAFVWEIHRGPVNSPHKWPVTRKMFPFDDVITFYISNKSTYLCAVTEYLINTALIFPSVLLKVSLQKAAWQRSTMETFFTFLAIYGVHYWWPLDSANKSGIQRSTVIQTIDVSIYSVSLLKKQTNCGQFEMAWRRYTVILLNAHATFTAIENVTASGTGSPFVEGNMKCHSDQTKPGKNLDADINTLRAGQNGRPFSDDICKWIFLNGNV